MNSRRRLFPAEGNTSNNIVRVKTVDTRDYTLFSRSNSPRRRSQWSSQNTRYIRNAAHAELSSSELTGSFRSARGGNEVRRNYRVVVRYALPLLLYIFLRPGFFIFTIVSATRRSCKMFFRLKSARRPADGPAALPGTRARAFII